MRNFLTGTYRYRSGRVIIKSTIFLTGKDITSIINIINEVMGFGYYEPCYHIASKIFHELGYLKVNTVQAKITREKFILKLS